MIIDEWPSIPVVITTHCINRIRHDYRYAIVGTTILVRSMGCSMFHWANRSHWIQCYSHTLLRKLTTRTSTATKLLLKCGYSGRPKANKRLSTATDVASTQHDNSAECQPVDDVVTKRQCTTHNVLNHCSDSYDNSDGDSDNNSIRIIQARILIRMKMITTLWKGLRLAADGTVYSSWRVTSCCSLELRFDQPRKQTGHSTVCQPLFDWNMAVSLHADPANDRSNSDDEQGNNQTLSNPDSSSARAQNPAHRFRIDTKRDQSRQASTTKGPDRRIVGLARTSLEWD